jgi:hypothetical protein
MTGRIDPQPLYRPGQFDQECLDFRRHACP